MERHFFLVLIFAEILNAANATCIDKESKCASWASPENCTANQEYMLKHCRKSCQKCEVECKDKDIFCYYWNRSGFCRSDSIHYRYMKKYCEKTCKICKAEVQCNNKVKDSSCKYWKESGYCNNDSRYYPHVKRHCQMTCEFCKAEDASDCIKNPCKNGGSCIDGINSYQCVCVVGYTGLACEQDIDECSTNPCKNGGTCIDGLNSYQCKCADGYTGTNCEKKKATVRSDEKCFDEKLESDCKTWKAAGDCKSGSPRYNEMKKGCQKTCGFCTECQDLYDTEYSKKECAGWAASGECDKNRVWMGVYCKKSCNKCSSNCEDIYDIIEGSKKCAEWVAAKECDNNPDWMHFYCRKSCNKCASSGNGSTGKKENIPDTSATRVNEPLCGLRFKARVVGGTDAAVGDWPWQVGIARSYDPSATPFCGGSLINKQWVVTANHCFGRAGTNTVKPGDIVILLGEHDISKKEGTEKVVKVSKIVRHEDYKLGSYDADITLVKLEKPVKYSTFIKPVCLPDEDQDETVGDSCYVTGWGRTQEGGQQAKVLQEAKLPIVSRKTCSDAFGFLSQITENMICAGFKKGGIDACQGDSGGPFVCQKKGQFRLTGVVSFGRGCARANLYGVYAKVSKYVKWIKRTIKE